MYLLDTNIISEMRRTKPHGAVRAWLESIAEADLYVSAVTIGEIQAGIEITREHDNARAAELESWLDQVMASSNVLALDAPAFRTWARLMHRCSDDLSHDAMIAATAQLHGFTVVTRNVKDFRSFGVPTLNPFSASR